MIEREVDFGRPRWMRCNACGREFQVSAEWLDRFDKGDEVCPECGTDCRAENRPDFWVLPDDPTFDASQVREMFWYHTSTHANWPDHVFDPTAGFSDTTRQRFNEVGTDGRGLERWTERQRTKALHLGTYEAAIENMFRRMRDQADSNDQFYLYRVRLTADAAIEPGVHPEPTNFVGDVQLSEISSQGADIFRYVNIHEDPSSVSLAVTVWAIQAVQGIPIPLNVDAADPWVKAATARLVVAASRPTPEPRTALERMRRRMPSVLSVEAGELEAEIAGPLPFWIRERFAAGSYPDALTTDPSLFSSKLLGLARLLSDPQVVLTALNAAPWRET